MALYSDLTVLSLMMSAISAVMFTFQLALPKMWLLAQELSLNAVYYERLQLPIIVLYDHNYGTLANPPRHMLQEN